MPVDRGRRRICIETISAIEVVSRDGQQYPRIFEWSSSDMLVLAGIPLVFRLGGVDRLLSGLMIGVGYLPAGFLVSLDVRII